MKEEEGRGIKGREGETRNTNPSLLPAPLLRTDCPNW